MSNYTKQVNFTEKDDKPVSDPAKVIKGSEFDDEFDAIAFAISTKADSANPTLTGTTNIISLSLSGVPISVTAAEINALANVGTNIGVGVGLGPVVTTGGAQTLSNKVISGAGISGGQINNTPIGGTTKNTGAFTTLDAESLSVGFSDELTITNTGRLNSSTYIAANEFRIGADEIVNSTKDATFNSLVLGTDAAVTSVPQYATGTFTPTLFSGATQQSAATATGTYIAVGDMVTVFITLVNIDTTGSTGLSTVSIQNLPFNCAIQTGGYYVGSAYCANIVNPSGTDNGHFFPVINANSENSNISLFATVNNSAQPETMVWNDVNDETADIHITLTYKKA